MDSNDINASAPIGGSRKAATLAFAGLPIGGAVLVLATGGHVTNALHESGAFGFIIVGSAIVSACFAAGTLFTASSGSFRMATISVFAMIVPFLATALGVLTACRSVGAALAGASDDYVEAMAAVGTAEVMSIRLIGASLTLGLTLGTGMGLTAMWQHRREARNEQDDSLLAALLLFAVAGLSLVTVLDARTLATGLHVVGAPDGPSREGVLRALLAETRVLAWAFDGLFGSALVAGLAMIIVAMKRSVHGSAVVGVTWFVCLVLGGGELLLGRAGSRLLERRAEWESVPAFAPTKLAARSGHTSTTPCIAKVDFVRCGSGSEGRYDDASLARALPRAPASDRSRGFIDPAEPALDIAIDARLPAAKLRTLLRAASIAGYHSLWVRGGEMPRGFESGRIPPWLRPHVPLRTVASWWLEPGIRAANPDVRPSAFDVHDGETMQSFATRVDTTPGDQQVLVTPIPLPRVVPAPLPTTGLGLIGGDPANALGNLFGASPPDPPRPSGAAPLDAATVQRIVRANSSKVRACYEQGLTAHPELAGRIDVRFSITSRGRVTNVNSSGTLREPSVVACIETAIEAIAFPVNDRDEPMTVTYPFVFASAQ